MGCFTSARACVSGWNLTGLLISALSALSAAAPCYIRTIPRRLNSSGKRLASWSLKNPSRGSAKSLAQPLGFGLFLGGFFQRVSAFFGTIAVPLSLRQLGQGRFPARCLVFQGRFQTQGRMLPQS